MIDINKITNTFHIHNNKISLFLFVNCLKHLETVYFGPYKSDVSLADKAPTIDRHSKTYFDSKLQKEVPIKNDSSNRFSRFEIGTHGLADTRPSTIVLQNENGNYETNLEFVSYITFKGYPNYENGPHAHDGNVETIQFLLKDEFNHKITVKYNISIDLDKNIIVKNFEITNEGKEEVRILKAMSLCLDLLHDEYEVHHFAGTWSYERREKVNDIIDGEQIISSIYGRSSHEENPFFFIKSKKSDEVIGFNFIYSGNFKASIFNDFQHAPRINYGLNDYNFSWLLKQNETFVTPQAVISYSNNGIDEMSQNFHQFVDENIVSFKNKKAYRPLLFNSWEGCEMNFNTESILSYIDDSKKIGSELFVLDDGWFSTRNNDCCGLGDWWVNTDKIDLKRVINHCHELGLKFGIWFEPEMVNFQSELFKKHPEYVIGLHRDNVTLSRHQFMLDFTNPEVVDCIFDQMCKVIDAYDIDYIKWDHNRDLRECYIPHLGNKRQGEVTHRMVLGYYDLIERLTKKYPDIFIEGCASGGGRFDLGTLYYTPQIWCSDNTDPTMRIFIQYNTSLGYPLSVIGSHVSRSETASYSTKAHLAMFGTYGYEMNPNKLTNENINDLSKVSDLYRKYHQELFDDGILYHLSSPETSNLMVMEVVNKARTKAMVIVMSKDSQDADLHVKPQGLDVNANYRVIIDNIQKNFSSMELMNNGIHLSDFNEKFVNCDSMLILFEII